MLLGVLLCAAGVAGVLREARGGRWSDAANWCPRGVPAAGDEVHIGAATHVLLDAATARLGVLRIDETGSLTFEDDAAPDAAPLRLEARTVLVGGLLRAGTPGALFERRAEIVLVNDAVPLPRAADKTENLWLPPYGAKMLAVVGAGQLELHAKGRSHTWVRLDGTAEPGAKDIRVDQDVDWQVGDDIVLTSTDFDEKFVDERKVAAVSGRTITLDEPLEFQHYGVRTSVRGVDIETRGEVMVLTSNFVIR